MVLRCMRCVVGLFVKACGDFSDRDAIGMMDCGGGDGFCVWVKM